MRLMVTKNISLSFKERLLQQGYSVVDIPLIEIKPIAFELKEVDQNVIFTSQNAVRILLQKQQPNQDLLKDKKCFCVGEKVKSLLGKNGQKVVKMAQNASELAHFLVKNHKKDSFSFFCGQQRRSEIETSLNQCKMDLDIHEVYKTTYTSKYFENFFDGILFFSPSAVSSYFIKNTWPESAHGFCIGSSTSKTLSKFTSNFSTAKNPTENQLLNIIHKYYVEK